MRKKSLLTLAMLLATKSLAGCDTATTPDAELEIAGYGAELRDSDHDGRDDYNDSWRFAGRSASPGIAIERVHTHHACIARVRSTHRTYAGPVRKEPPRQQRRQPGP